jgi:hypothetical protein
MFGAGPVKPAASDAESKHILAEFAYILRKSSEGDSSPIKSLTM